MKSDAECCVGYMLPKVLAVVETADQKHPRAATDEESNSHPWPTRGNSSTKSMARKNGRIVERGIPDYFGDHQHPKQETQICELF
jgi:hypothetical protein